MAHLTIDQEKCIKCNRCVQDCPMGIADVDDNGNYFSNEHNAEVCIYCGHCVAVCPTGAVKLNAMKTPENLAEMDNYGIIPFDLSPEDCIKTQRASQASAEGVEALMRSRKMARSFKKQMVGHDTMEHIINDVLKYAPSGHNTRGFKATIVEGREKLDELTTLTIEFLNSLVKDGVLHSFDDKVFNRISDAWDEKKDRIFRGGQQVIIISCKSSIVPADPAVKVMLTYFELIANALGLGTVWAGYFMVAANYPPIKQYLGLQEDDSIYGAMIYGYPDFEYELLPKRPDIEICYK